MKSVIKRIEGLESRFRIAPPTAQDAWLAERLEAAHRRMAAEHGEPVVKPCTGVYSGGTLAERLLRARGK